MHPTKGMTLSFGSIGMDVTFGIYVRGSKEILLKRELKNLRYKISTGTNIELTDGSRAKVDRLLDEFKREFRQLRRELKAVAAAS
jgi:hypothetical protein